MPGTLLERIWFSCRHQFSWPRRSERGDYYQVCVECGVKYRYDWSAMRRMDRLELEIRPSADEPPKKPVRKCGGRSNSSTKVNEEQNASSWRPRERRLRFGAEVLYREKSATNWLHGQSENISRSGLLFQAEQVLPLQAELELMTEMPAEISGIAGAKVVCQARVARVVRGSEGEAVRLAVTIDGYEFLSNQQVAGL